MIKSVCVVGGTHGNETNGVYIVKHFEKHPNLFSRPSFQTKAILGNPRAIKANTRYSDKDLNRCFLEKDLADSSLNLYEQKRAREINELIGPKGPSTKTDLVIDLHNTTANTGILLCVFASDSFALACAAYVQSKDPSVRVEVEEGSDFYYLSSVGRSGMILEVGPVPWGVLDGSTFSHTKSVLHLMLDYTHIHNTSTCITRPMYVNTVKFIKIVDYPRDASGDISAMVHPRIQGNDYFPLTDGDPVFLTLAGKRISFSYSDHEWDPRVNGPLCPYFINEAAYYEQGVAFSLGKHERILVEMKLQSITSKL